MTLLRFLAVAVLALAPLLLMTKQARGDNMPPNNPPPAGGASGSPGADASGSNGSDSGCCSNNPAPSAESPPPIVISNAPAPTPVDNAPAVAAQPEYVAPVQAPQTRSAAPSAPANGTDIPPDFKPPDAVVDTGKTPQVDIQPQPIAGAATSGDTGGGSSGGRSLPVRVLAGVAIAASGVLMMFGTMLTDTGKALLRWGRGEPEPPSPTSATGAVKG